MSGIFAQYDKLEPAEQEKVEILILVDNKKTMLGTKRNKMLDMAQGEYVVFADDDDILEPDYISSLLKAAETDCDVITFQVNVTLNGESAKICTYSKDYEADYNTETSYHRLPNHIMCVKKDLAMAVKYRPILYGEDADYSKRLKAHLKTEHHIDKVLYNYVWNVETTETQFHLKNIK
jgi:glycosyltransferase involved in cell wall biosynthesis